MFDNVSPETISQINKEEIFSDDVSDDNNSNSNSNDDLQLIFGVIFKQI